MTSTRQASASKLEASNVEKHQQLSDFFHLQNYPRGHQQLVSTPDVLNLSVLISQPLGLIAVYTLFLIMFFRGSFLIGAAPEPREVIPTALWYRSFNLGILITSAITETPTITGNTGAGVSSCF